MLKRLLLSILFVGTLLHATVPTNKNVTELYVATFMRAPDAAGLEYWMNQGLSLEAIAESFFEQPETQAHYPSEMNNGDFINTVYNNLFNHDADIPGYNYWLGELNDGKVSRSNFILAICNGALADDELILNNKTFIGLAFVADSRNDLDEAYAIMRGITAEKSSVCDALNTFSIGNCLAPVIVVSPGDAFAYIGSTRDFRAEAIYFDGHTEDITASSIWSSSDESIAMIDEGSGRATGISAGVATMTARFNVGGSEQRGIASLHVLESTAVIETLEIVGPERMPFNTTVQLCSWATMTDGSAQFVNDQVEWSLLNSDADFSYVDASGRVSSYETPTFIDVMAKNNDILDVHNIEIYAETASTLSNIKLKDCEGNDINGKLHIGTGETVCMQAWAIYSSGEERLITDAGIKSYFKNVDLADKCSYIEVVGAKRGGDMLSIEYNNKTDIVLVGVE